MAITDPMKFEQVRDSLETLLENNAAGLFQVITGQKQSLSDENLKGNLRTIQIFYSEGTYDQGKSSNQKLEHDFTFSLQYYVTAPAVADVGVIESDAATAAQKATALAGTLQAFSQADKAIDEFRRIITQIIMNPENRSLGLAKYTIGSRWLKNFRKSPPADKGSLVLITATESLTGTLTETLTGETPTLAVAPTIDITNDQRPLGDDTGFTAPESGVQTSQ